jgi:LPS export ABC transporter protein LptC
MQRLARGIPVVVVIFVAMVVAMLVTKSRTTRVESAQAPLPGADLQIKRADIEEQSGTARWRLVADQALVFDSERRTALKKISVVVQDADRSWTIVADEGDMREPEPRVRNIEVRRNVVVTSHDGMRLETSVLRWDSETKRLWTDRPVRIVRAGTVVSGSAFELLMAEEASTVQGRVRATFSSGERP